jgi:pimeloyl-ACP methyl ester carboxylesterase
METYVCVHGAFGGGWELKTVASLVRAAGHDVYTPTLTGMGERSHLASPDTDLETYIHDIVNVFKYEDLSNVILTGHSFGGMVITGVADRIPDRISHLIYVDSPVPEDGQSLFMLLPGIAKQSEEAARTSGDGWLVPPAPDIVEDPRVRGWAKGRYGSQPIETMRQPIRLTNPARLAIPRTYIYCTDKEPGDIIAPFADRARNSPNWSYYEIAAFHDPQITHPRQVAEILLMVRQGGGPPEDTIN